MSDVDLTAEDDRPVLETLAAMTAVSLERCTLSARELMIARLAAIAAVGGPPASYLLNLGAAADMGLEVDDVEGILVGVAPVIGTSKTTLAAGNILRAFGFAIAAIEAELEEELAVNQG